MGGSRRWWLAELADETCLRAATPDWDAIAGLGLFVYARSADPIYHYAVRAFVGAPGRFEDAASGAANATLAAWLASRGALPGPGGRYRVSQGREIGHDAIIELQVDGRRGLVRRPRVRRGKENDRLADLSRPGAEKTPDH